MPSVANILAAMTWDPEQNLRYADQRALPFRHLVAAVDHLEPAVVVDLGCGPGGLTATLLERWPSAMIFGVDTSEEMIDQAPRRQVVVRLSCEIGDARIWRSMHAVDLILANACFHWIHDHRELFNHLVPQLTDRGVLAFQVPANHTEPSQTILADLATKDDEKCGLNAECQNVRTFTSGPRQVVEVDVAT